MEGLGEAFSGVGNFFSKIQKKDTHPDRPIPQSFILPHSPISIISPVYIPKENTIQKQIPMKILSHPPPPIQTYPYCLYNDHPMTTSPTIPIDLLHLISLEKKTT